MMDNHVEAPEELLEKTKLFFAHAVVFEGGSGFTQIQVSKRRSESKSY